MNTEPEIWEMEFEDGTIKPAYFYSLTQLEAIRDKSMKRMSYDELKSIGLDSRQANCALAEAI